MEILFYISYTDKNIYRKIIFNSKIKHYLNPASTIICNDTRIGLAAGSSSKNSIMIICGTGSNCFGVSGEGKEAKVNGWDYCTDVIFVPVLQMSSTFFKY